MILLSLLFSVSVSSAAELAPLLERVISQPGGSDYWALTYDGKNHRAKVLITRNQSPVAATEAVTLGWRESSLKSQKKKELAETLESLLRRLSQSQKKETRSAESELQKWVTQSDVWAPNANDPHAVIWKVLGREVDPMASAELRAMRVEDVPWIIEQLELSPVAGKSVQVRVIPAAKKGGKERCSVGVLKIRGPDVSGAYTRECHVPRYGRAIFR